MKIIVLVSRILVGSLFIVSGLVKANDPLGFSYKLEEYFAESALDMMFLNDYALILASLACIAEIVLGVALLLGGKIKWTVSLLLLLTVFFGWLTMYTATCDVHGKYTTEITAPLNSAQATSLQERSTTEASLTFVKQDGENLLFNEVRDVTCVTDCGCFGDALKGSLGRSLTPWESFYKDLILFILLIPIALWTFMGKIKFNTPKEDMIYMGGGLFMVGILGGLVFGWWFPVLFTAVAFGIALGIKKFLPKDKFKEVAIAVGMILISVLFCWYTYNHLPIKDYRAYKPGLNISEGMKLCHEVGEPCPVYENYYVVRDKATGKEFQMTTDDYLTKTDVVDFVSVVAGDPVVVVAGYEPPVVDFEFSRDAELTQEILSYQGYYLYIISKDPALLGKYSKETINDIEQTTYTADASTKKVFEKLLSLSQNGDKIGVKTLGWVAGANDQEIELFRHELQLPFTVYSGDDKTLKTIIRSNPGLVLVHNGTIVKKWHANDIPTWESLKADYIK